MKFVFAALVALAIVGTLDWLTGYQISFSVFYLVPVGLAAWYAGRNWGIALSLLASVAWYGVESLVETPYDHSLIPVWNAFVRFVFFLVTSLLLSALRDRLVLESRMARTDGLTGLLNSRAFGEQLTHDLALNARTGGTLTVVFIDLDDFKAINDAHGHQAGDRHIQQVAERIGRTIRHADTAGRLGGDEFGLILPATDRAGATALLDKLVHLLRDGGEDACAVSCSIGALTVGTGEPSADAVIGRADALMYEAKHSGKNRWVISDYTLR